MRPSQAHRFAARVLQPLSPCLRLIERKLIVGHPVAASSPPILFIIGSPRSGTTLTFQCLTHYLDVLYPSHLAALFPLTPAFGLWLSNLIYGNRPHRAFRSLHGFSLGDGLLGPDEWETLFRQRVISHLSGASPSTPALSELPYVNRILSYMSRESNKPIILKVPLAVLHIDSLARLLPTSRFLYIERSPLDTARSIYRAKRLEGKAPDTMWYVQPELLRNRKFPTEAHQIIAQIREINRLVTDSFSRLDSSRKQNIRYEQLCLSPKIEVERIGRWLGPSVRERRGANLPHLTLSRGAPLNDDVIDGILRKELG
jgi:hypothetical protein